MKINTKILSFILTILIALQGSVIAMAQTKAVSPYTKKTYTHQTKFDGRDIFNGIDVSEHNGEINFEKVKGAGIDFVFVRVGYTGYTKSKFSLNYDKYYKTNIENALKAGLSVGVYWYSQALNINEAVQEADKLLSVIKNYDISMPVVFDYEFADTPQGRLDSAKLSKTAMTNNAFAFLDRVNEAGYEACLYANEYFLNNHLNASQISQMYKIWLASYTTNTNYAGDYDFWQYSANGKVNGVWGNCDVNFWYSQAIENLGTFYYTGKEITPVPVVKDGDKILTQGVDYEVSYNDNIQVGKGIADAVGIGEYENESRHFVFDIVPKKPTGLTLEARTATSLDFKWNAVSDASSYKLNIKNNTTGKTTVAVSKTNKYSIKNLTAANEYSVTVSAGIKNSDGILVYGPYSKANTKHALPKKVTGVKVKSRTTSSITITWDKMKGCDGYRIYRRNSSGEYKKVADVKGSSKNTYKFSKLKAGTVYYFKVSAFTVDSKTKVGTKSSQLKAASKPSTVSLKSISTPKAKKITVKWKKVSGSGYQVQWSTNKDFRSNVKSVRASSKSTSKSITTAQRKKKYYVRVRAYKIVDNKFTYGSWSKAKSIKVK